MVLTIGMCQYFSIFCMWKSAAGNVDEKSPSGCKKAHVRTDLSKYLVRNLLQGTTLEIFNAKFVTGQFLIYKIGCIWRLKILHTIIIAHINDLWKSELILYTQHFGEKQLQMIVKNY